MSWLAETGLAPRICAVAWSRLASAFTLLHDGGAGRCRSWSSLTWAILFKFQGQLSWVRRLPAPLVSLMTGSNSGKQ